MVWAHVRLWLCPTFASGSASEPLAKVGHSHIGQLLQPLQIQNWTTKEGGIPMLARLCSISTTSATRFWLVLPFLSALSKLLSAYALAPSSTATAPCLSSTLSYSTAGFLARTQRMRFRSNFQGP